MASIERSDRGAWDFQCVMCGFRSIGWETKTLATARKRQHNDEHDGAEPAERPQQGVRDEE